MSQPSQDESAAPPPQHDPYPNPCQTAFHGALEVYSWNPTPEQEHDLIPSIDPNRVIKLLRVKVQQKGALRWYMSVNVRFIKQNSEGNETTVQPYFTSRCMQIINVEEDIASQVQVAIDKISRDVETFLRNGSGWVLERVIKTFINIAAYKPLKGKSYIPLPNRLHRTNGIINIQNTDNKCFMWSILAQLHPARVHPERVNHYRPYQQELDFSGIELPMTLRHIPKFERQNQISICVFGYDEGVYPLYITSHTYPRHVNLLLISDGNNQHYCLIRDLNRFLAHQSKTRGRHFCHRCLHGFTKIDLLAAHKPYCQNHAPQKIQMPKEGDNLLKFTNIQHQLKIPFVIYADFEAVLPKMASCEPNPSQSSTTAVESHVPCGFSYKVTCTNDAYSKPAVVYRGPNPVEKFLKELAREEYNIKKILKKIEPMKLRQQDKIAFQNAVTCHICDKELGQDRVMDHDHLKSGYNYRGAAHRACNINYKYPHYIPVIFHGLRNYDSHLIISEIGKAQPKKVSCIPNNLEKYISFSINSLRFIDSAQFLNTSLDTLVQNLAKEGTDKFPSLKTHFPNPQQLALLLRKGVYPYSYMDHVNKFEELQLPSKEHFFNILKQEPISDQDYTHAQNVWNTFQMQNLGEYHDLYLKTDVLLLEAVFENFRTICLTNYCLDPAHYFTSPGLSWSAALRMTAIELELLTDIDMHLYIENGIRGGVSMIGKKYAKANNPYVDNYDPEKLHSHISYLDANNLYGWSMSRPLPQKNFKWVTDEDIKKFDINEVSDDSDIGYILEVDLDYPKELHDLHSDYPLAPENVTVSENMLSPYSKNLLECLGMKPTNVSKLIPNLNNKTKYILHHENLKQYLGLGMKLTKIHRILSFTQSPWLEPYIKFNTEQRKLAKNEFEKDFFKLMNNSVFGKTMENLRNHVNVELVTHQERLRKVIAKPNFTSFRIFDENLAAVQVTKPTLTLNRPIYAGMAILDLSKTLMYDFHYNHIKTLYGDRAKLLLTDTDSLCYEIETPDIYADMAKYIHLFDTSNFQTDHPLHSNHNKKVIGKFKDECPEHPPREFVGLKPKMYSIDLGLTEKKVAKGVMRSVIKCQLRHSLYKQSLFEGKAFSHSGHHIRSISHKVNTLKINKISLTPFDDKKYFINERENLAHGHYKIRR